MATSPLIRLRLWALMFLEFFVWGAWIVPISSYMNSSLGFTGTQIGWICAASALGALISPLFLGYVADRFFATERVLGVLHFAGAASLFWAAGQTSFPALMTAIMVNALCFMPTLPLVNNLVFRNIDDKNRFPRIAVGGTIGWIVAGLAVGIFLGERDAKFFHIAAAIEVVTALYCFTLPHTPPKRADDRPRDIFGLSAVSLLRDPGFLVFAAAIPLVTISKTFYTTWTNAFLTEIDFSKPTAVMTLSQASEIVSMIILPWFIARIGLKRVLVAGMAVWAIRYFAFASMNAPSVIAGLLLHGFSYGFVVTGASIYAAKVAPPGMTARAQSFIALLIFGIGMFFGAYVAGFTGQAYQGRSVAVVKTSVADGNSVARVPLPAWDDPVADKGNLPRQLGSADDRLTLSLMEKLPERGVTIRRGEALIYAKEDLMRAFRDADHDKDGIVEGADWQRLRRHAWPQIWAWAAALAIVACLLFGIGGREPEPMTG